MKNLISPVGLGVLSFVLLAGCNGDDNKKQTEEQPDAQVSVAISSRHQIPNVRKLILRISPVYIFQSDTSYIRVLQDVSGQNLIRDQSQPHRDITLIDTLESPPLPTVAIASNAAFSRDYLGRQSHLHFYAWSLEERDSYVELDDGRYCEINLILPGDHNPSTTGDQYAAFSLQGLTINGGERWRIHLLIDIDASQFSPTNCASTQDLRIRPDGVTFQQM